MKRKYFLSSLVLILMMCICIVGCKDDKEIELSVQGNVYEITRAEQMQFETNLTNINEADISYVVTGDATITDDGLLTVNELAEIGQTISVMAVAGNTQSNTITLNVVDKLPESLTLTCNTNNKIAKGGDVELNCVFSPTYSTATDYTLSLVDGDDIAELVDNKLSILDTFDEETIDDDTVVVVKATLNADHSITSTLTLSVVKAEEVDYVIATNKSILVGRDSNVSVSPIAYNGAGTALSSVKASDFTYTSSDESVATVAQSTGKIIAKGHGEATITVRYLNGKETTCKVFVMVPPESINIDGLSPLIVDRGIMDYSLADKLNFNLMISDRVGYTTSSQKFDCKFELLDEDEEVSASGDSVAVLTEDGIEFKQQGKVRLTVTSNSSLNNAKINSSYEKSVQLLFNINDGINVGSVSDLVAYANDDNRGKICNITSDLYLTETEGNNFGHNGNKWNTLLFKGDRYINGNGYIISTTRLPLNDLESGTGNNFIEFNCHELNEDFVVQIRDWEVLGCGDVEGKYSGELTDFTSQNLINGGGDFCRTYRRGIVVYGSQYKDGVRDSETSIVDMVIENVEVSGFSVGLRISHAIDGLLKDITIRNCFSNGIENEQNTITIENFTLGQVGAFGIEVTPDSMMGLTENNPQGTAGPNYNETSTITITGSVVSDNYNNGSSTTYMGALALEGNTIPQILAAIVSGQISLANSENQSTIGTIAQNCLYREGEPSNGMNFYLLIFIEPGETNYTKGNTEGKFAEYSFDSESNSVLNISDIITNLNNDLTWDEYKYHKYISLDLDVSALGMPTNLGQVICINQAYVGE